MYIQTLSTFPEIFDSYMSLSIMRIAQEKNLLNFTAHNLRNWTHDTHMTTDDKPYGGGCGQLMMCQPIFEAYEEICKNANFESYTIMLSPSGEVFNEKVAAELLKQKNLLFVCGHYEGIDERVYKLADKVISLGDYVVSSGELASLVVIDSIVRKIPGVLGASNGAKDESFVDGLLEHPQYTRPSNFQGMKVPEVLLSGDHAKIKEWKRQESLRRTLKYRPDLLKNVDLDKKDKEFIDKIQNN